MTQNPPFKPLNNFPSMSQDGRNICIIWMENRETVAQVLYLQSLQAISSCLTLSLRKEGSRLSGRLLWMRPVALSLMLTLLLGGCSELAATSDEPTRPTKTSDPTTTSTTDQAPETASVEGQLLPIEAHLYIGDRSEPILLEVARTPQQQMLGLMHRDRASLPENQGMFFPFERPRRAQFWMKNVKFSLDMLFISRGKIKAIAAEVPPCVIQPCPVYGPDTPVEGVIELAGGQAEVLNLRPGDAVTIEFLEDSAQSNQ